MKLLPDFLTRLGLDTDADEAAVEQAYARELRRIDPAQGPATLQSLRTAREQALQWARTASLLAPEVPQPTAPAGATMPDMAPAATVATLVPPAAKAAGTVEAEAAARAVFYNFALRFSEERAREARYDAARVQAVLEENLSDERLQEPMARRLFERLVVEQLAAGWKPGNELLFAAAADAFRWEATRNRLAAFGEPGETVAQAFDQWQAMRQARAQRSETRLLEKLREANVPNESDMGYYLPLLRDVAGRYARLLPLVTDMKNVASWLATPDKAQVTLDDLRPSIDKRSNAWLAGGIPLGGVIAYATFRILLGGMLHHDNPPPVHHVPQPQYEYDPSNPIGVTPVDRPRVTGIRPSDPSSTLLPPAMPYRTPEPHKVPPPNQLDIHTLTAPIKSKIVFNPRSVAAFYPDERAFYTVELDARGNVGSLSLTRSSGMGKFDEAVAKGIRASAPFPADANGNRPSMFTYSITPADLTGN